MCKTCEGKSNRNTKKGRNGNQERENCLENDEEKQKLPKCPNPRRRPAKAKKYLSKIEKIMLRIQPPIADRERYFHPEHVNCFLEESERVYVKKPSCPPCPLERPRTCTEDKRVKRRVAGSDKDERNEDDDKAEIGKNKKTENGVAEDDNSGIEKQEDKDKVKSNKEKETIEENSSKNQTKKSKKRKHKAKRTPKDNAMKDKDSELSICSNDSEICLVGLRLTAEDKERIEENRRKVHPPPDKEDQSVQRSTEVQELQSTEEGEDKKL